MQASVVIVRVKVTFCVLPEVHTLSRYLDRTGGGTGGSVCRNRTPNRTGAADIHPARFG